MGRHMPAVGSNMEIELREGVAAQQTDAKRFYMRVRYNGKDIRLGDCAVDCPISAAAKYLDHMVPTTVAQWNSDCDNGPMGDAAFDMGGGPGGDGGIGGGSGGRMENTVGVMHPSGEYLGMDADEWSTMALLLACVLVLENVIFEVVVCRFFFGSADESAPPSSSSYSNSYSSSGQGELGAQRGEPSTTGAGPRGGSLLRKSKYYYDAITGGGGGGGGGSSEGAVAATTLVCCRLRKRSLCCGF